MRSILVQAGRDPGMSARLETALSLARANEGHVTLLIDTPVDRYVTTDPYGGTFVAREALDAALKDDEALAEAVSARLERDDVPFDVVQFELPQIDALANAARLADLVVVSRAGKLAGDLAVATSCPVLALPNGAPLAFPVGTACIAWDGGDQAARALRAVAPMLSGCRDVHVITVTDKEAQAFPATDALRYLSRHGIKAELHEVAKGHSVEETLRDTVRALGASLLVMGAYSHTRVREFLFGGVTRFFLEEESAPPLLLSH